MFPSTVPVLFVAKNTILPFAHLAHSNCQVDLLNYVHYNVCTHSYILGHRYNSEF
jgi:hypothetical protein